MIKSVNILQPIMVEFDNDSKIFYLDIATQTIFDSSLKPVSSDMFEAIFSDIEQQNISTTPEVPIEEIWEAMNTEKKLAAENYKHIFRRE